MTANQNILQYESTIWATADLLRGCGIKESDWPSFMMPFFALLMIEAGGGEVREWGKNADGVCNYGV
jgi:hypothetical protein